MIKQTKIANDKKDHSLELLDNFFEIRPFQTVQNMLEAGLFVVFYYGKILGLGNPPYFLFQWLEQSSFGAAWFSNNGMWDSIDDIAEPNESVSKLCKAITESWLLQQSN